jgi:hypothetical protein
MSLKMNNNNENLGQILEFKTKVRSFCQVGQLKKVSIVLLMTVPGPDQ